MKAVILAGGLGTRLSEETELKPKPMVEIGGRPILWHIMKTYAAYGISDFVICLGYKGYLIKEYFTNYFYHMSNITVDLQHGSVEVHQNKAESWRVTLIDTGELTQTGGRLKRVASFLDDEPFCFTYGDGLADIDISQLIAFHKTHGQIATITATQPPGRFGALAIDEHNAVTDFHEKPLGDGGWINGGYFVLDPQAIDYITDDQDIWEQQPLRGLAASGNLRAFRHRGFWQPMDTLRDKHYLDQCWNTGHAAWKVWQD